MADPTDIPSVVVDGNLRNLGVTASIAVPLSASGLISAGVGTDGIVRYLSIDDTSALKITGSLTTSPGGTQTITGTVALAGTGSVIVTTLPNITGSVNVTNSLFNITGSVGLATASIPVVVLAHPQFSGSVNVTNTLFNVTGSVGLATASVPVVVVAHPPFTGSVNVTNTLFNITGTVGIATASIPVVVVAHPQFSGSVNVTNTVLTVTGTVGSSGGTYLVSGLTSAGVQSTIRVDASGSLHVQEALVTGSNVTSVNGSATAVNVLAGNSARRWASIHNDSPAILFLKFGTGASNTSYTVRMVAQAYYEVEKYNGVITGIWQTATGSAKVTELL